MMRLIRFGLGLALLASAAGAQATTVIIFVEPMTLERYTRVFDTPGPDRALMCPAPPATGSCTEIPIKHPRQATVSSSPSNNLRPSMLPWAGSTTRSG
jgi:hypothetical protein